MKLELCILAGAQTKEFLSELAGLVERLEKAVRPETEPAPSIKVLGADEDDDFAPAPAKKAKAAKAKPAESFDDEEDAPAEMTEEASDVPPTKKAASFDDFEDETEEAPAPAKKTKAPKEKAFTMDDVNDACMERAGRTNRSEVLGILKKFKVKSVTELQPAQYADVIKALK